MIVCKISPIDIYSEISIIEEGAVVESYNYSTIDKVVEKLIYFSDKYNDKNITIAGPQSYTLKYLEDLKITLSNKYSNVSDYNLSLM